MSRIHTYLLTTLLVAFHFGANSAGGYSNGSQSLLGHEAPPTAASADTLKRMHFEPLDDGEMYDQDGVHLAFTSYKASNAVGLLIDLTPFYVPVLMRAG